MPDRGMCAGRDSYRLQRSPESAGPQPDRVSLTRSTPADPRLSTRSSCLMDTTKCTQPATADTSVRRQRLGSSSRLHRLRPSDWCRPRTPATRPRPVGRLRRSTTRQRNGRCRSGPHGANQIAGRIALVRSLGRTTEDFDDTPRELHELFSGDRPVEVALDDGADRRAGGDCKHRNDSATARCLDVSTSGTGSTDINASCLRHRHMMVRPG